MMMTKDSIKRSSRDMEVPTASIPPNSTSGLGVTIPSGSAYDDGSKSLRNRHGKKWTVLLMVVMVLGIILLSLSLTIWKNDNSPDTNDVPISTIKSKETGVRGGYSQEQQQAQQDEQDQHTGYYGGIEDEEDTITWEDIDVDFDDAVDDYSDDGDYDDDDLDVSNIYNDPNIDKLAWPELVGIDADEAKMIIISDTNHQVDVELVPEDAYVSADYRTDRVRVYVTEENLVARKPMIG